jgi:hypothetical protein
VALVDLVAGRNDRSPEFVVAESVALDSDKLRHEIDVHSSYAAGGAHMLCNSRLTMSARHRRHSVRDTVAHRFLSPRMTDDRKKDRSLRNK